MAIPVMALLQQHDARRDNVIEPAARRGAAIDDDVRIQRCYVRIIPRILTTDPRTGAIRNWGRSELGAQSGRKNPPASLSVCL